MRTNRTYDYAVKKGSYTVTVGDGGAAHTNGSDSVFATVTSTGGGYGSISTGGDPASGGSGGGGGAFNLANVRLGAAGTAGQGNAGGDGHGSDASANDQQGAGGGGASAVGVSPAGAGNAGDGGAGIASLISGASVTYAGGGGGGKRTAVSGIEGAGGTGGGGKGGAAAVGTSGTANTGGGGGGGGGGNVGGAGGSGVVIISYLTTKEVTSKNAPINGLVGWWPFDSSFVTDKIYDRSGRANNGYYVGGATSTAIVAGKLGKALKFDGVGNYVKFPIGGLTAIQDTTPSSGFAWIKTTSAINYIVTNWTSGVGGGWIFYFGEGASSINFGLLNTTGGGRKVRGSTAINNGVWHHVGWTYDGSQTIGGIKLYIDGRNEPTTQIVNTSPGVFTNVGIRIGIRGDLDANFFNGLIDDVRIYNRALTYAEVQQLYNSR